MNSVPLPFPELPPRDEREPLVISNSSMNVFSDCRRKYWLQQIRSLYPKQEKRTGPLALGSRVHLALEKYYQQGFEEGFRMGEDAQAMMDVIWKALVEEDRLKLEEEGGYGDDFDKEAELGRIMLEGFIQWMEDEGIDANWEIIGLEDALEAMIDLGPEGKVRVVGKLDQRIRRVADGARYVRDWKTAVQFADQEKTIENNNQFKLYMILEALSGIPEDERVAGAQVIVLRKVKRTGNSKPPFYMVLEVAHNVFTMRSAYKRLHGIATDIARMTHDLEDGADPNVVAYPNPTRDCSWKCPFAAGCSMFDNGSDAEGWLADNFHVRSRFDYYGDLDPLKKETP